MDRCLVNMHERRIAEYFCQMVIKKTYKEGKYESGCMSKLN